jgi:uncharacterized membrane protein YfcA
MLAWLVVACVAGLAGFSQGLTGFGFALVFTPIASLVLPPRQVVVAALLIGGLMTAALWWEARRQFSFARIWPLVAAGMISTPVGSALLVITGSGVLRGVITALAVAFAFALLLSRPHHFVHESRALAIVGAAGGFLNGSTSMGGGLPALVLVNQGWTVGSARSGLLTFNLASYLVAVATSAAFGLLNTAAAVSLAFVPVAVAGAFGGSFASRHISQRAFYRALVGTVACTSVAGLVAYLIHA